MIIYYCMHAEARLNGLNEEWHYIKLGSLPCDNLMRARRGEKWKKFWNSSRFLNISQCARG